MSKTKRNRRQWSWLVFIGIFGLSLAVGASASLSHPAVAAPQAQATLVPTAQPVTGTYAGSEACAKCHEDIHTDWMTTRHAQAFSSPIFQQDWTKLNSQSNCLQCHTTGYDPKTGSYSEAGVSCEACH